MIWPLLRRPSGVWVRLCHKVPQEVLLLAPICVITSRAGRERRKA